MAIEARPNTPEPFGSDPYLAPYAGIIRERKEKAAALEKRLTGGKCSLEDFSSGHEYFGLHKKKDCWLFREWAPLASGITLVGDFSNWERLEEFALQNIGNGVWEIKLPLEKLRHGMHYLMHVSWSGGAGNRIPAYARRVVQDKITGLFSAMVWSPEKPYIFKNPVPPRPPAQLIYEVHPGMAQEEPKVGSFREFQDKILPRIAQSGYNTVEFMAVWKVNFIFFVKSYLKSKFLSHVKSFEKVKSISVAPVDSTLKSRIFICVNVRCMVVLKAHDCGR